MRKNLVYWQDLFDDQKERLRQTSWWFPYPAFLSFGLIVLFIGHLLLGINPRFGNPSDVMVFDAKPGNDNSIWFTLTHKDDKLAIATGNKKVFFVPLKNPSIDDFKAFNAYLDNEIRNITLSAGLAKKITLSQSSVVLSVDQSLTYSHIRPVLYALAKSGISTYGFETKLPLKDQRIESATVIDQLNINQPEATKRF